MYYYNGFSDIGVKFENGKGYYFHGMSPWIETNVPEGLIKALPYYKLTDTPKREKTVFGELMSEGDKILLKEMYNALPKF